MASRSSSSSSHLSSLGRFNMGHSFTTYLFPCKHIMKYTILSKIFCLSSLWAQEGYLQRKAEGWHFYEELFRDDPSPVSPKAPQKEGALSGDPSDPVSRLKAFRKRVEYLKAAAVMDPTRENVQAYMTIQKQLMARSSRFAQRWMEVVYTTPHLDYTIQHPTSQAGRHVYLDQQKEKRDQQVRALSQTYGLFFFFSNTCAYCKSFAPIVKAFADTYGWEVMAISMDGSHLPEFPQAVRDNGTARSLGVQFVPTLLAVNPVDQQTIPLSHGMSSQDQILDRIRVLIMKGPAP